MRLQVLGRGGIPAAGVSAVVMNVTVTAPTAAGYLTAYPGGTATPNASNLNFVSGQTVPNLVTMPVGTDGTVALTNGSTGSTHLISDVAGYIVGGAATDPGTFGSLPPTRLLDTRSGIGAGAAPVPAHGSVALQVLGRGGVPASGVQAVVLNVTVTGPQASGYVTAYPNGTTAPTVSNLNFAAGLTVPNLVVVPVGADGKVALANGSDGSVQLVADIAGYFRDGVASAPGAFSALAPTRLLDTRSGVGAPTAPVAAGGTLRLQVLGRGGIPAAGVAAVVLNVTVTRPMAAGYVTAYPDGTAMPTASNLNYVAGQTVPNLVLVPVGPDGKVALTIGSTGTADLIADLAGYVRG